MKPKDRLELTWIGKYDEVKAEPRTLIEDVEKSYGDKNSQNMLIKGDNLLALKTLEQEYTGKIKCIYIDPPYNTGNAFEKKYEDGLEHSQWLTLMKPRLNLLKNLLKENGTLAIQIDDHEYARLYLLLCEIFNEKNLKTICVRMSEPTGVKMSHAINNGRIPKLKEYIVIAKKDGIKDLWIERIPKEKWDNEYKTILLNVSRDEINFIKSIRDNEERDKESIEACDKILAKLQSQTLSIYYKEKGITNEKEKLNFNFENSWRIIRTVSTSACVKLLADKKRVNTAAKFFTIITPQRKMYIIKNGYNDVMGDPRIKMIFSDDYLTLHPGDIWSDIKTTGLDNEGGINFKNGKKPEALVKRIISMATNENDVVLDSFLGSGTTAAVAHKMNRRWIGIELNGHCDTHCVPRLKAVVDGTDQGGISKAVNWKGGGGFKYYTLN